MDREEAWLPVVGFEGFYEVSSLGKVMRVGGGRGAKVGRILRPVLSRADGYPLVQLYKNRSSRPCYVHRLVAQAFLGPAPAGHEVNHKDGDKLNPRLSNVEWVTKKQNGIHAARVLRRGVVGKCGSKNPMARAYIVFPPNDEPRHIQGLHHFCKEHGLDSGSMTRVAQGKWAHHKGWRCEYASDGPVGNATKKAS